jgi:23S rRNA (adenine2503-C2)-methyltransferase
MIFQSIKEALKNESPYRQKQAQKALLSDLIESWEQVSTLSLELRKKLKEAYPLPELKLKKLLVAEDEQTMKALLELADGQAIESVLMKHKDGRRTVCLSSQVGCQMNCQFCATGQQGFQRNLLPEEIIAQVLFFARLLKKEKEKVTNVVFMGMGEPFLNYDNVLEAVKTINSPEGMNLGSRKISISTAGIPEAIEKLAQEPLQVNLAVSLHAPTNELRSKLMPINKTYPIEDILKAVDGYLIRTKRKVMFEYLMIDRINDNSEQAEDLIKIMKKPLYFLNLISFNPIGHCEFRPSPDWKIKEFGAILEKAGVFFTKRYRFGQEIDAACGQLAGKE